VSERLLTELAWLPRPPADWRLRVEGLGGTAGGSSAPIGTQLRALAAHALDINQLARLSRRIAALRARGESLAPLESFKLALLSNATTQLIAPALIASAARHGIALDVVEAPYDQTLQSALDPGSPIQQARPDAVLLAVDERALPLQAALGSAQDEEAAVAKSIAQIHSIRTALRSGCGALCIVQTLARRPEGLFGSLDFRLAGTRRARVERFNRALAESLAATEDLLFDVAGLAEAVGLAEWHDPVQWHLAKLPFSQPRVPLYADHVARLLAALRGKSRRCLVLDLDNTIWGGVVADDGLENLVLGPGDPAGEAFLEVQRTALELRARGVVLAVCSKNSDAIAALPFRAHPEMLLRERDVAVFQANFEDKASNLKAIADALGLGVDALVLLDDHPAERAQVRAALPEVAVPELGDDPAYFPRTLWAAGYFEAAAFSEEDRQRADMYRDNAQRVAVRERIADLDVYLESLNMVVQFAPFDAIGRARIAQLVNKSNQFNLTTRRYTSAEIQQLEERADYWTLQVRLADQFGDSGMISVVICKKAPEVWEFDTWLMSCRVLGRRVEEAVLAEVAAGARAAGARRLLGRYVPTPRNELVREHYRKLGFVQAAEAADGSTVWTLELASYRAPGLPLEVRRLPALSEGA
jgi:FkbH-like protein